MPATRAPVFDRLPLSERVAVLRALKDETTGGFLLLAAAALAVGWANSPWAEAYASLRGTVLGPSALHLDLSLETWAADGLLAVFFLVAGLELKRELVLGELRHAREAVLPVVAAVCGMAVPALVYVAVNTFAPDGDLRGWAVPVATDIAFALAVLAVISSHLPTALRAFLLSLAVVDDLLAILVIAVFFTSELAWAPLGAAAALLAVFALLQRLRVRSWLLYVPLGLVVWTLVHASGVHATVAGVALGLLTRVRRDPGEHRSPAERTEDRVRPLSAGLCVPLFALLAAGVSLSADAFRELTTSPIALGIVAGLVLGKTLGITGGTYLTARFTRAELNPDLRWLDVLGVAMLAGIGFTVSLLVAELSFADRGTVDLAKAAILTASLLAAALASVVLSLRNRAHRRIQEEDERDDDADGVPDVYQRPVPPVPSDGSAGPGEDPADRPATREQR